MEHFHSEFKSLGDDFFKNNFNIPIYQRLYVWGNEQVKTLIDDLVRAYEHDQTHEYYLGGVVVVENGSYYDLVDGQQRFTTLKILRDLLGDSGLTLDFVIRNSVWEEFESDTVTDDSDIIKMREARKELSSGLDRRKNISNSKFLNYLKTQVKLVVTIVPNQTGLNKLFELINGRGEQLKQHEILKAKILAKIEVDPYKCGKIWDICANMDDFMEINIKKSLGESWSDHHFNDSYNQILKRISNKVINKDDLKMSTIIDPETKIDSEKTFIVSDLEDEASTQYLSIISFELFLLYALVSFEKVDYFEKIGNENIEFKDKNLIKIFEIVLFRGCGTHKDYVFTEFVEHMFNMRVKFDDLVIKDHKDVGDSQNEINHKLCIVEKSTDGNSRKVIENAELVSTGLDLLQSMLYHSHTRNTQEWIIPYIKYFDKNDNALVLLENIDNELYSQINIEGTVLKRAVDYTNRAVNINYNDVVNYLSNNPSDHYNHISHYWFYKMDWIIWRLNENNDTAFKFTARNSIEHIGPQNPKDENIESDKVYKYKHSFGNLFLLSVNQNSSVGNQGFHTKKAMFFDKKVKNLKLGLLSDYDHWGDSNVEKHFKKCLLKIEEYFIRDTNIRKL